VHWKQHLEQLVVLGVTVQLCAPWRWTSRGRNMQQLVCCNVVVALMKLCACVGSNCKNWIMKHGTENVQLCMVSLLSCPWTWNPYGTEVFYPLVLGLTDDVLRDTSNKTLNEALQGKRHHKRDRGTPQTGQRKKLYKVRENINGTEGHHKRDNERSFTR